MLHFIAVLIGIVGDLGFWAAVLSLPFALFRKTRFFAGKTMFYSSYAIGASFWVNCLEVTLGIFGIIGSLIGICFFGVGVVILALIGFLKVGQFQSFIWFLIGALIIFAIRYFGILLMTSGEKYSAHHNERPSASKKPRKQFSKAGKEALGDYLVETGQIKEDEPERTDMLKNAFIAALNEAKEEADSASE